MKRQRLAARLTLLALLALSAVCVSSQETSTTSAASMRSTETTTPITTTISVSDQDSTTTSAIPTTTPTEATTTTSATTTTATSGSSSGDSNAMTTTTASATSTVAETVPSATTTSPGEAPDTEPVTRVIEDKMAESPTGTPVEYTNDDDKTPGGGDLLLSKSISNAHSDSHAPNSVPKEDPPSDNSDADTITTTNGDSSDEPAADNAADHRAPAKISMPSRLNMTEIDQVYLHGVIDEQESADNWNRMGKKLKKGIGSVIGNIVPFALNMSQEAKISNNCSGAVLKWVLSMNQLKAWALRMLDASGKPIAGLLEGSMTMFGNYRQCLKVRAPDDDEIEFAGEFREYFRGKYCVIQAKPWLPEKDRFYNLNTRLKSLVSEEENEWYDRTIFEELNEWFLAFNFVNIRYDICVPSVCTREDIQKAINYILAGVELKARVLRCETDQTNGGPLNIATQVESGSPELAEALVAVQASTEEPEKHSRIEAFSQLGWIVIPMLATSVVLIATALSFTLNEDPDEKSSKLKHTIRSLSLKRSVNSHLNVDYDQLADDKPLSLYGLRFLLVIWVILVDSIVNLKFEYLRELMMLKDLIFCIPAQFVINSTLQYDSFILLTAFTMGYKNCLNDGINNVKAITRYVLDKYVRLMPSIMVMVAVVILMPLVYRGPVWNDYVPKQSAVCQSTGWVNVVFLQNYLPYDQICIPQTWLLCVEFQLLLIMAPLVYYLNRSYISKYGVSSKKLLMTGNGMLKNQAFAQSTSRRDDSSKALHWLWTTPGTILVGCIVLGLASSFYNVYSKELPPSWFYTMADPDSKALYFGEHMTKIWTHIAVFAMGILAGVECRRATKNVYRSYKNSNINFLSHQTALTNQHGSHTSSASSLPIILSKNGNNKADTISSKTVSASDWNNSYTGSSISINIHNNRGGTQDGQPMSMGGSDVGFNQNTNKARSCWSILVDIVCFLSVITIMSAIIFSTRDWSLNELPKPLVAGLFDAGSRFLWSVAMIWVLYMISVPNKDRSFSCIARGLGHPAMVALGKLSFLIYIIHPSVHTMVLAIQEQPIYSSWLMLFHILLGNITLTVILASLISLFVEMPCRNLFRRCGTSLLLTQSGTGSGGGFATLTEAT